ncbi:MAG: hypothetical protein K2N89_04960 [Lachnospiraceae bacterium]|nr:hypothetical protein [Lachnospiraceae bacterium]
MEKTIFASRGCHFGSFFFMETLQMVRFDDSLERIKRLYVTEKNILSWSFSRDKGLENDANT